MLGMKKKPKRAADKQNRHAEPREAFHLPADLQAALEVAAVLSEPPAGKSAVIRFALEKYLTHRSFYPPSEEQLRQLLEKKDLAELSAQVQGYLKNKGVA